MQSVSKKPRTENGVKKDMAAFRRAYHALSKQGKCDAVGGCEYERVRDEWIVYTGPMPVREFIYERANIAFTTPAPAAPATAAPAAPIVPVVPDERIPVGELDFLYAHEEKAIVDRINEKHLDELRMRGPVTGAAPRRMVSLTGGMAGIIEVRFDPEKDPAIVFHCNKLLSFLHADLVVRLVRLEAPRSRKRAITATD